MEEGIGQIKPKRMQPMLDDDILYTEPIPAYGDVIAIEDWKDAVRSRFFIDYDGYGCAVKNGKCTQQEYYPSDIDRVPATATHIVWFNR